MADLLNAIELSVPVVGGSQSRGDTWRNVWKASLDIMECKGGIQGKHHDLLRDDGSQEGTPQKQYQRCKQQMYQQRKHETITKTKTISSAYNVEKKKIKTSYSQNSGKKRDSIEASKRAELVQHKHIQKEKVRIRECNTKNREGAKHREEREGHHLRQQSSKQKQGRRESKSAHAQTRKIPMANP